MPTIVALKINQMPEKMLEYGFPCGETYCSTKGTFELELQVMGDEYKMALCREHAAVIEEAIRIHNIGLDKDARIGTK